MDRIKEKLALAASVATRASAAIEADADALIAREAELTERRKRAFAPHNAAVDQRLKELDSFGDSLQVLENTDPLEKSGDSTKKEDLPATQQPGSGAPTEPGFASGADAR